MLTERRNSMTGIKKALSHLGGCICLAAKALLLPFVLLLVFARLYGGLLFRPLIYLLVWFLWLPRGVFVLFVYPNVAPYRERFAAAILPHIHDCSEVLTWPNFGVRHWRRSIAVATYRQFVARSFVPMAVVFRPFQCAKRFSFYPLWQDYRDGKPGAQEALSAMEQHFLDYVDETRLRQNA